MEIVFSEGECKICLLVAKVDLLSLPQILEYQQLSWLPSVRVGDPFTMAFYTPNGIILSGEAFQYALHNGIVSLHRDIFHTRFGVGRLMLAMGWYKSITGSMPVSDRRIPLNEEISEVEYKIILKASELV